MPADSRTFQEYFKEIRAKYHTGDYTEITLRTPLENFIRSLSNDYGLIQEPKRTQKVGAPDFKAFNKNVKVGYIETKDLGINLDEELKSEQIQRYRNSVDNIVLTNYTRFILLRGQKTSFDFNLFDLSDLGTEKFTISNEKKAEFLRLIEVFFTYPLPTIESSEELAFELSKKAKLLKYFAKIQLEEDFQKLKNNEPTSAVYDFYTCTKELIKDIKTEDCADAYAETITYGLFLAKKSCPNGFDRRTAPSYIPSSVGIIKKIFMNISGDSLPSSVAWVVDETIDILNASDIKNILLEIDTRGKKDRDPFIFFYEGFLSTYDPERRKHLGVYYTPRPVVSFIVNSINNVLERDFQRINGLADDDVTVLDPAVGTGTFLWLIYTLTLVKLKDKGLRGLIEQKIENHLLKDFYGLEILITPYIIAHLKLSLVLKKWFYEIKDDERIQVYLANTLEPSESHSLIPFLREITEESKVANELKLRKKILVITSNPPYRGMSVNKGVWIESLLKKGYLKPNGIRDEGYYRADGKPLEERNPKWLQDDYVKFIRFAQWKVDLAEEGIIGFITNHSYLDNPTFRGMRQSLLNSFNRIYILNLHGSSLRREKTPDGKKDENVFDVRPGVAIAIFEKNSSVKTNGIFYADLFGTREEKYAWLDRNNIENVKWKELHPCSPQYFFVPKDNKLLEEYNGFLGLTQIFNQYSLSVQTHRDSLAVSFDNEDMTKKIDMFRDLEVSDDFVKQTLELTETASWKIRKARRIINQISNWQPFAIQVLYRPFDIRYMFYHNAIVDRMRNEIMKNMKKPNLALLVSKQLSSPTFTHVLVTGSISDAHVISNKTKEGNYHFPLYQYIANEKKKPNINEKTIQLLKTKYSITPSPEEIFYYIYAVLHSNKYREKYVQFLQSDFARIPFAHSHSDFKKLSELGNQLVDLHLMKTKYASTVKFDVEGSNEVRQVKYVNGKIYINNEQFFDGIPEVAWHYRIGCYNVLEKWLKSRKNRKLGGTEVEKFIQIVELINSTLNCVKEIDKIEFL